jgi:hypothetical protein
MRPKLLVRRLAYGLLIGDRAAPGLARAAIAVLKGEKSVYRRLLPSVTGQLRGALMVASGRGVRMHLTADQRGPD